MQPQQDIKETLEYVCQVMRSFGLRNLKAELLRKAKFNDSSSVSGLKQIVFALCLLYISDFKINLEDVWFEVKKEEEFDYLLLILLKEINSPFIFELSPGNVASNLNQSRDLLMMIGWMISVTNLFDRYREEFLLKGLEKIENMDEDDENISVTSLSEQQTKIKVKDEAGDDDDRMIELFNKIKFCYRKVSSLNKKREQILATVEKLFRFEGNQLRIAELLLFSDTGKFEERLRKLEAFEKRVEREGENVKHEQLFWMWMESIVDVDKKDCINELGYEFEEEEPIDMSSWKNPSEVKNIETFLGELKKLNEIHKSKLPIFSKFTELWNKELSNVLSKSNTALEELKEKSKHLVAELDQKYLNYDNVKQIVEKKPPYIVQAEIINAFTTGKSEGREQLALEEIKKLSIELDHTRRVFSERFDKETERILGFLDNFLVVYRSKSD